MTPNEYQDAASATADYPGRGFGPLGLSYVVQGLVSEVGELTLAVGARHIHKEMGDVLWYVSQIAVELGYSMSQIINHRTIETTLNGWPFVHRREVDRREAMLDLFIEASRLADQSKKHIRDDVIGRDCSSTLPRVRREAMKAHLHAMVIALSHVASDEYSFIEHVADANIEKLADRKARGVIKGQGDER